ncbi:hypothetical protein [Geobacillus sp. TFV-3]|uniref:hypothetical protein n=1 Tax=Geobacillus sp. TFV-3 TaxID=1897059 RepID=UPI001358B919|nr:hypothetical protein [Geobacillus sp. TFV-3]
MRYVKEIQFIALLYLFLILLSGILYSYTITRIVSISHISPFWVIIINSIISIFIFIDFSYIKKFSTLHSRFISAITSFLLLILFFLSSFLKDQGIILLVAYAISFFSSSYVGRSLERKIFEEEKRLFGGMVKISIVGNLAKLIGFGVGAFIFSIPLSIYIFLSFILFLVMASVNVEHGFSYSKVAIAGKKKVNSLFLLLFVGLISSIPILWIPSLVERFNEAGMIRLSFIPFVLPGIMNILFLRYLKDRIWSKYIPLFYFVLTVFFMAIYYIDVSLIFQVIVLSTIITLGVSINVYINTIFLQKNKTRDKRELMQLINVVTSVSTLLFSFFTIYISLTVHLMLLINATLSLFIFVFFARIRGEDE